MCVCAPAYRVEDVLDLKNHRDVNTVHSWQSVNTCLLTDWLVPWFLFFVVILLCFVFWGEIYMLLKMWSNYFWKKAAYMQYIVIYKMPGKLRTYESLQSVRGDTEPLNTTPQSNSIPFPHKWKLRPRSQMSDRGLVWNNEKWWVLWQAEEWITLLKVILYSTWANCWQVGKQAQCHHNSWYIKRGPKNICLNANFVNFKQWQ